MDPLNPDMVYTASVVTWKSTDGGHTFAAFRGAPGGDDYHRIWINPKHPRVILLAADQGAVITVNGGETWSCWYNQPTAQFYHVSTDNAFPYRVCGGQQESGSACCQQPRRRRADHVPRVAPGRRRRSTATSRADPLDPDIVYGGRITRYDRRTGQVQNIAPSLFRPRRRIACVRTMPVRVLADGPSDPLLRVERRLEDDRWREQLDGDLPDLTRETWEPPANVGKYRARRRPRATASRRRLHARALAYRRHSHLGRHRRRAHSRHHATAEAPGRMSRRRRSVPWAKVSLIEASHFDAHTAYAAINTFRLDDLSPHISQTTDGGKTWTEIVNGIPPGGIVNAVREDPQRRGLLFAGTEQAVYVSFDDGDDVAVAADEHARDVDPRSRDQGRRSRGRNARPIVLDPRRHHAAADSSTPRPRRGSRDLFRAAAGDPRPLESEHGHPAAAGRAGGTESA